MYRASGTREAGGKGKPPSFSAINALHIFALLSLAVSHPLYTVLSQANHTPFFIAHQSRSIDIWLLVLILSVFLPALICTALWLVNFLSKKLASVLYLVSLFTLCFLALLPLPERWLDDPGYLAIVLPFLTSVLATTLYVFAAWVRSFVTIMSLAIIISPVLFLSSESVRSFMSIPAAQDFSLSTRSDELPDIVMIVLDELPLISLLDAELNIDAARYPNFNRLIQKSTWFRNTSTVHYSTSNAMVSLLVGEDYRKYLEVIHQGPVSASGPADRDRVPYNLFSLLENKYQVFASELVTKLAPEPPESVAYIPPIKKRIVELLVDSAIIFSHLVTPGRLQGLLPQIEGQWRGFTDVNSENQSHPDWPYVDSFDRTSTIKQFIDSIQNRNAPSFFFLHSLLPHYPFVYNERGQIHSNRFAFLTMNFRETTGNNDWPNELAANLAQQAHLLQLGFCDLLLGQIIDQLESEGMFEDSLILLVSDHGTNYFWDSDQLPKDQLANIQSSGTLYVPFFIKMPRQTQGYVSEKPLQTIDVVPTIADILDIDITWPVSGISALGDVPDDRQRFSYLPEHFSIGSGLLVDDEALRRKLALFGTNRTDSIYQIGPHREIVDQPLSNFRSRKSGGVVKLKNSNRKFYSDPEGWRLKAYVDGKIYGLPVDLEPSDLELAIAVNGVIRNTTKTTNIEISSLRPSGRNPEWRRPDQIARRADAQDIEHEAFFLVRLPPGAFVKGRNEVTVHAIRTDAPGNVISLLNFDYEE